LFRFGVMVLSFWTLHRTERKFKII